MDNVYVCLPEKKSELQKILDNEPTATMSFARLGYDFKDGKYYGIEGWVLYLSGDEESIAWAEKQLGSIVKKLSDDKAKKVIDAIKKEKDSASEGFGELFG